MDGGQQFLAGGQRQHIARYACGKPPLDQRSAVVNCDQHDADVGMP